MMSIRVLLADDHALVRQGLRALIEKIHGAIVVAEVSDGLQAVQAAKDESPDVVLMDIAMPGLNGLEALTRLKKECPSVKVIMLSMYAAEEYFRQALEAGASGYLLKDADRAELEIALMTVSRGETYLTPEIAKYTIHAYQQHHAQVGVSPLSRLTSRQREILQLVAEGQTTKDIAQRLDLSPRTVETHRADIMERLQIHDLPGLVRIAIQNGLIQAAR
jgi:DNA-binding NarL/FixJ family response regulator